MKTSSDERRAPPIAVRCDEQEGDPGDEADADRARAAVVECRREQPGDRGDGHHPGRHSEQGRAQRGGPLAEQEDRHRAEPGRQRGAQGHEDELDHRRLLSRPAGRPSRW